MVKRMNKKHILSFCFSAVALFCGISLILISFFGVSLFGDNNATSTDGVKVDDTLVMDIGSNATIEKVSEIKSDEPQNADSVGTVYYIDAVSGSDLNDGLSPETAFKTLARVNTITVTEGTYILFKRGCVWNGGISIVGSGSKEKPVVIGMYGDSGDKPMINGNGSVESTVRLYDASYITVRNLEITNYTETPSNDFRSGIRLVAKDTVMKGITIQNCYIHHINFKYRGTGDDYSTSEREYGGISTDYENLDWKFGDVSFEDLLIENNRIDQVVKSGIVTYGGVDRGIIRNNILSHVAGDGILLREFYNGMCEHNIVYSSGDNTDDAAYVNIWGISTRNTVFQFNESYDCINFKDGQGYDIDNDCRDTLFQYNYSHDNVGGFLLTCDYFIKHVNSVVRYNISENDAGFPFKLCAPVKEESQSHDVLKYHIYNNTIYTSSKVDEFFHVLEYTDDDGLLGEIYNNIFFVDGDEVEIGTDVLLGGFKFSNNCYVGFDEISVMMLGDPNSITENPLLLAHGTAKTGIENLFGYQLLKNSPCIEAGIKIPDNGGRDYFGNEVSEDSIPNIGAYEGEGVERPDWLNLCAGRLATPSGYYNLTMFDHKSTYIRSLTDEKISTSVSTNALKENGEAYFEIPFDEEVEISSVLITAAKNPQLFPKEYRVEAFIGGEWTILVDSGEVKEIKGYETIVHNFETVKTDKIRVISDMLNSKDGEYRMELAEISAFAKSKDLK